MVSETDPNPQTNSEELWEWTWLKSNFEVLDVDTLNCVDVVKSWTDVDEGERDSILNELETLDSSFLCPNFTSFELLAGLFPAEGLYLNLTRTAEGKAYDGNHFVYQIDVTQYFTADFYNENGFQNAIVLQEDEYIFSRG